jgi:orotate phosphoribosyltransferase
MESFYAGAIDILEALPARHGHFLLESGYHTDVWLTLDALFVDPARVGPLIGALAERLHAHSVSAVCGPLLGGAFLAHAIASILGIGFYYTEPAPVSAGPGLFKAEYRLSPELRRRISGQRIAIVDDFISAGSSVRATIAALTDTDVSIAVVGALVVLGRTGLDYFAAQGVPVESLGCRHLALWKPAECPLCRAGSPLDDPERASNRRS